MDLVRGDVTALREAGVGSGFRLLVDTGTFHGLIDAQRAAMGKEVSAVAAPDASLILDCFAPRRRGPLPRGASRAEVERAFSGLGGHRCRGGGHRAGPDRAALQVQRALLPAAARMIRIPLLVRGLTSSSFACTSATRCPSASCRSRM